MDFISIFVKKLKYYRSVTLLNKTNINFWAKQILILNKTIFNLNYTNEVV